MEIIILKAYSYFCLEMCMCLPLQWTNKLKRRRKAWCVHLIDLWRKNKTATGKHLVFIMEDGVSMRATRSWYILRYVKTNLLWKFMFQYPLQVVSQLKSPARGEDALIADQFEVSECTLPGPSVGDITEDGVVASCHPPLALDTNGKGWDYNQTLNAIWTW